MSETYEDGLPDLDAALDAVGGDRDLLQIVIRAFLDDAPAQLERLSQARLQRDAAAVRSAAHAVKGAVRYFGRTPAYDISYRIELGAAHLEASELDELIAELRRQIDCLSTAVGRWAADPDPPA